MKGMSFVEMIVAEIALLIICRPVELVDLVVGDLTGGCTGLWTL
jgi:hypothetical protein